MCQRLGCLFRAWLPNYARLLSSVSSQLKMAASNSMKVGLTGSQPSELVEGASTRLTWDALSQLRSPKASDLARSRVVSSNKKKGDSGHGPGKVRKKSTTLKTNFVDTRMREFKDEPFRKPNNKLFCEACREEHLERASIIKRHVDSQKHKSGVEKVSKEEGKRPDSPWCHEEL